MNNSQNNQRSGKRTLGNFSSLALFETGSQWKVKLRILATTALLTVIWPGAWAFGSQTDPYKIWMLAEIAGQYAAVGQKDKAAELLGQALPLVEGISDDCDKPEPIAEIARQYAAAGQEARSSQLLAQAIRVAKTAKGCSGVNDEGENLGDIATRYWENGQYDQTLQILRQLGDDTFKALALAYYAPQLAEVGRANQATAVLAEALQIGRNRWQVRESRTKDPSYQGSIPSPVHRSNYRKSFFKSLEIS
jgi:tetratricopeptide (TPR) repeat protein